MVTATTHKTLRGPRGAIILTNDEEIAKKIDSGVFPRTQGGPLEHVIAAKAVAFREALSPGFRAYNEQILKNAKALAGALSAGGVRLVTGGTDNHMGYTCFHIPEPLLNVDNCFSVRLRAPNTGSIDIATYYMSNYTCEYARALTERAIEGGYQFLDAMIGVDACSMMNRAMASKAA